MVRGHARRRGASGRERLGDLVGERGGGPGGRAVDGIDGVGDEEPGVQLEVVGGEHDQRVEQLAGLQHRGVGVRVAVVGVREERRQRRRELRSHNGPEWREVHGRDRQEQGAEEHEEFSAGGRGRRGGGRGGEEFYEFFGEGGERGCECVFRGGEEEERDTAEGELSLAVCLLAS